MNEKRKIKVGVVGCGVISHIYMTNLTKLFENVEVIACTDLIPERAEGRAKEFGIPRVYTPEEFYRDEEIELVVNITPPKAHNEVDLLALEAGKNVYSEKPFGINKSEALPVIELAKKKGLIIGGAPETFLGGGLQTCRKLIDDGWIGIPLSATAFMMSHGPESWHPDPAFFYQVGGGPMFDMGPYYLTALVSILGPVKKAAGATKISYPERVFTCEKRYGERVKVEIPTYIAGTLTFESGVIGTIITSFDSWASGLKWIEIQGTEGTLRLPDPNTFGGPILVRRPGMDDWKEVPLCFGYTQNARGIGVSDIARILLAGEGRHRAHYEMAYHVLDIMQTLHESADTDRIITLSSTCERPAPLPLGLRDGEIK